MAVSAGCNYQGQYYINQNVVDILINTTIYSHIFIYHVHMIYDKFSTALIMPGSITY